MPRGSLFKNKPSQFLSPGVSVIIIAAVSFAVLGCTLSPPSAQDSLRTNPALLQTHVKWWRPLGDLALNDDIDTAFSSNPSLETIALRIHQAEASISAAQAALLPALKISWGYHEGRKREPDFGPYSPAPWKTKGLLSWEADLSGKLRSLREAAIADSEAALWDYHAARLLLSTEIAATRLNLYRLNAEIHSLEQSMQANRDALTLLSEQHRAGLLNEATLADQRAENRKLERHHLNLIRLRDRSLIQLRTLRGGTPGSNLGRASFPPLPKFSPRPLREALSAHPSLLVAAAKVKAAFHLERSARLNLLPTLKFTALASGRTHSLTERYRSWMNSVGPTLDIPIYDPRRLAALQARKALKRSAAADYRATALQILEEVDTAQINLRSHRAQTAKVRQELREVQRARDVVREQWKAGLTSRVSDLEAQRRWLSVSRTALNLQQATLNSYLNLIKAVGGGTLD